MTLAGPSAEPVDTRRALPAPDRDAYARGHALFEARSDQRARIVEWLGDRLAERAGNDELSVLSVGCGPGAVDRALAERACREAPSGARRSWTGVDPHQASTESFLAALEQLDAPGLTVLAQACTFADLRTAERYDVVAFVHSLYYVADLAAAVRAALDLLAPGGELLVLHAPLGALNSLAAELAPPVAGHPQPWSDAVQEVLDALPVSVVRTELDATVDLSGAAQADPTLLDFTAQAVLDAAARAAAVARLEEIAEPGPGLRVAHPVTAFVVRPASSTIRA